MIVATNHVCYAFILVDDLEVEAVLAIVNGRDKTLRLTKILQPIANKSETRNGCSSIRRLCKSDLTNCFGNNTGVESMLHFLS